MFQEHDTNKDGFLSVHEFQSFLAAADNGMKSYPATAQVASQQGKYLGKVFNGLAKNQHTDPFTYSHYGSFAYVGSNKSVADFNGWTLSGLASWWLWRSFYLAEQHSLRTKVLISVDWMKAIVFGRDISKF